MAGSLFTYMTWCKSSATWLQQDVDRTTERDEQLLGTLVSRRIKMLRQVNERLFWYFEVPRWNGNSNSNLCNAQKLADEVRAYFADEELW